MLQEDQVVMLEHIVLQGVVAEGLLKYDFPQQTTELPWPQRQLEALVEMARQQG